MIDSRQSCLRLALVSLLLLVASGPVFGQTLTAFPGAEGAGKWTVGGRGGKILFVTNLKDSGGGSLRAAVEASGHRTVVFRVAGTIWLKSALRVRNPYLTLAGQSAPGEGITVAGNEFHIQASEVIVRYMRFRLGDLVRADIDAVTVSSGKNIILDHLSASWGVDETLSVTPDARDVTVQWCLISESLLHSVHSSGQAHGKGSLLRGHHGARLSFYHNLYAHHADRAPMIAGMESASKDPVGVLFDFRNNVIYDWGFAKEGWEAAGANRNEEAVAQVNFVNNAYLVGPTTAKGWLPTSQPPYYANRYWAFEELSTHSRAYWAGNTLNGALWKNASGDPDPRWMVSIPRSVSASSYFLSAPVAFANAELPAVAASASTASVLAFAGASRRRDAVDLRVIRQVKNGTGGMVDSPKDVGGWPVLATGKVSADKDGDGLPDGWEKAKGLNPASRADSLLRGASGRTWLEVYHDQVIDLKAVRLTVTSSGHGTVSAGATELALGEVSSLSVTPEAGYIIDHVEQNGERVPLASLSETPELWSDTTLHFVFARPRIPLPAEFAGPIALLLNRHPVLNSDQGGMLHLSVTAKGTFTGVLWTGVQRRGVIGEVVARAQEVPRIDVLLAVKNALPLRIGLELRSPADVSGTLSQGDASTALTGWTSPWHRTRKPLPIPQRGIHNATLADQATASAPPTSLRVQAGIDGLAYLSVRFSDRRLALCTTRLSPEGRWLLWCGPLSGRAPAFGQGQLEADANLSADLARLAPAVIPYSIPRT